MSEILTGKAGENRELIATFCIKGEPISKQRPRFSGHAYTPQKTRDAEEVIAIMFKQAAPKWKAQADEMYAVEMAFTNGTRRRRDIDNMAKLILDALNKVAWTDDHQVSEITAKKTFGGKGSGRTDVTIWRVNE